MWRKFNLKGEEYHRSVRPALGWTLPLMSRKEGTPGQTQDMRERLHLPLGLGTPQYPPRGDGGNSQGEDGQEPPSLLPRLLLPLPWVRIRLDGTIKNSVIG